MPEDSELLTRASLGPKYLTGPAPDREEWKTILRYLENAPCHDDAYPFRVVICEDREALGEVFLAELPEGSDTAKRSAKCSSRNSPRAPMRQRGKSP